MNKKLLRGIIGGTLGFLIGIIAGGYIGLVIGGNFLGKLELYNRLGVEGYVIGAYAGAIVGAIAIAIVGVYFALRHTNKAE